MKKYDAIIIGFGKGGKTLASDLAARGQKVAVIEKSDKMYGGTCINIGCIPTKVLVHEAKEAAAHAGFSTEEKNDFYRRAVRRKNEVVELLRNKNYHKLADHENITVYTGTGAFVSPTCVTVTMPGETLTIEAESVFIDTGAETVIPPIEGVRDSKHVYTSTTLMDSTELPGRLAIIGGGYIGLEFASMYASFGSEVVVLEGSSALIPREDRDVAESVQAVLTKKGIAFRMNARVTAVRDSLQGAVVTYEDACTGERFEVEADAVLLATGRKPATAGLNLEAAGVQVDERGAIVTDARLRTSNPAIRAIGDVKGGLQFTYISLDDYRIIREDLFGNGERTLDDRNPVSYSVFIDPPLARIGMSEDDARKKGLDIEVKKLPVSAIPRAHTLNETEGLFKAVLDARTNRILGCTLFGPEAGELINTVAMAMQTGRDGSFLRDFIFTHPSMSEALNDLFA